MNCIYCGQPVPQARAEAGVTYCMNKVCGDIALAPRRDDFRLINMPKQGYAYVYKDSPDLKYGKSSGRQ